MKKALVIGIMVAALVATNAQAWQFYDTYYAMEPQESVPPIRFRGLEWFCDSATVAKAMVDEGKTEDDISFRDDSYMVLTTYNVAGFDMIGAYAFADDDQSFITGIYESQEKHIVHQEYYDDFLKLQDALIYAYGDVTLNDDHFYLDYYKDPGKEDEYGIGVALGYVELVRGWMDADGAAIVLAMTGGDKTVDIAIYYIAPGISFQEEPDVPNTDGL